MSVIIGDGTVGTYALGSQILHTPIIEHEMAEEGVPPECPLSCHAIGDGGILHGHTCKRGCSGSHHHCVALAITLFHLWQLYAECGALILLNSNHRR